MMMDADTRAEEIGKLMISVCDQAVRNHRQYSASSKVAGNHHDIRFLTLALCGEAGELANVIKKQWRGDSEAISCDAEYELADVLAYTLMLAHELDLGAESLLRLVAHKQAKFVEKMRALHGDGLAKADDSVDSTQERK